MWKLVGLQGRQTDRVGGVKRKSKWESIKVGLNNFQVQYRTRIVQEWLIKMSVKNLICRGKVKKRELEWMIY